MIALLALSVGGWLAWHYPIAAPAAPVGFALSAALFFWYPSSWLLALPALLPIIGFAPYSGWISFEECDLLVLATAAGGYGRLALQPAVIATRLPRRSSSSSRRGAASPLVWLLLAAFGASVLVALWRGFADAGGFQFGWFQGYMESMNSVRLAKSFFLAALLLPLWRAREGAGPWQAEHWLLAGLGAGLALAALATLSERLAFTGLLNFSTDYRTTGLFWEMHVGGAALDGFLALTMPFALLALMTSSSAPVFVGAALALALGGYSCITTFSRGVYLAVPVGAALTLLLWWRAQARQRRREAMPPVRHQLSSALLLVMSFSTALGFLFPTSGYRGMLGVLGTMAAWLAVAPSLRAVRAAHWVAALVLGAVLSALAVLTVFVLPKSAYVVFAMAVLAVLAIVAMQLARTSPAPATNPAATVLPLACLITAGTGLALVAMHWGGVAALFDAAIVLAGLTVLTISCAGFGWPVVPASLRWRASAFGATLLTALVVAAIGGGAYMSGRFATGGKDMDDRFTHWREGLAMLSSDTDWLFGKGLGRFPAADFFYHSRQGHPGDYRIIDGADGNSFLRLSAGKHAMGWGELLRISQRVAVPLAPVEVQAKVRTAHDAELHFEVCAKQLLYDVGCMAGSSRLRAQSGQWQNVVVKLTGNPPTRGDWWAPAPIMFSMAVANPEGLVELDNVALIDGLRADLLANGSFSSGMAHWFFSSDRMHLPWHIKNIFMHVLFDQGALGLTLLLLMLLAAGWRLFVGRGRDAALAPALAGGLGGFLVVGLFDSLLDVPRVALLFYLLLMVALVIRPGSAVPASHPASAGQRR